MPSPPSTPRIRNTPPFPPAPKLARAKLKSSSLDHEIFLTTTHSSRPKHHRPLQTSTSVEWHHQHQAALTIPRTGSTSSLASSTFQYPLAGGSNYHDFKNEIINQGKCLCGQYIRARLRRAGVLNRKVIQRMRSLLEPSSEIVYEVFPALNSMGEELERMHPRIYTNVSRQLSRAPYGELVDSDTAPMLMNLVAKQLFSRSTAEKERITWAKIISVFAVCGGFAIDCVRQGHYDYLQCLVDGVGEIIEDDLVHWLVERGGWMGLQQHIKPKGSQTFSFLDWLTLFVAISSSFYAVANFLKQLGCQMYSLIF
ncbi:bcl-2-related ovarian killer protein homolog B [Musca domestica]|uniref:Apoptosis regulator protein, Bcl-2 family n=1 Tax=Musca domestica TaxID=7370 RepID=T1PC80_MUSDO|nr:bcl-2-related ovarian killer protein homolog B [Musca domestica]XP_058983552.1 bcl-2-related ovarian killer protein homolog B [Musca domestica]